MTFPKWGLMAALSCSLFLSVAPVRAQENPGTEAFSTANSAWDGYSELVRLAQRLLGSQRVVLTKRLDLSALSPADAVFIAHPEVGLRDGSLSEFLADGGRVALLDDFGRGETLLRRFGITRVPAPSDPVLALRDNPDLAIATPSTQIVAGTERGRHPVAAASDEVVTNHAQVFAHPDLTSVLEIQSKSGRAGDLAVTGVIAGKGRLLALGDPSVFINLMLRYPGNRKLAEGLLEYLVSDRPDSTAQNPPTKTPVPFGSALEGKVYIVTNRFDQLGHYGDEESLAESLRKKLEASKEALSQMKESGIPPELALALSALLSLWIFMTQLRSQLQFPKLTTLSFAQAPPLSAQTGWGARAQVLSAKKTNPALSLIELDAALRETLAKHLEISPSLPIKDMTEQAQERGLTSGQTQTLSHLLLTFRRYGQSLAEGKATRATEKELEALHKKAMQLISEIERRKGTA